MTLVLSQASPRLATPLSATAAELLTAMDDAIVAAGVRAAPFRHGRMTRFLPPELARRLDRATRRLGPEADRLGAPRPPRSAETPLLRAIGAHEPLAAALFEAATSPQLRQRLGGLLDCDLDQSVVRLRVRRDVDGYAEAPRAETGVVSARVLISLWSDGQADLGPDLYDECGDWAGQPAWPTGAAMAFRPSSRAFIGFEPRLIRRGRTSLTMDYLAPDRAAPASAQCLNGPFDADPRRHDAQR